MRVGELIPNGRDCGSAAKPALCRLSPSARCGFQLSGRLVVSAEARPLVASDPTCEHSSLCCSPSTSRTRRVASRLISCARASVRRSDCSARYGERREGANPAWEAVDIANPSCSASAVGVGERQRSGASERWRSACNKDYGKWLSRVVGLALANRDRHNARKPETIIAGSIAVLTNAGVNVLRQQEDLAALLVACPISHGQPTEAWLLAHVSPGTAVSMGAMPSNISANRRIAARRPVRKQCGFVVPFGLHGPTIPTENSCPFG